MMDADTLLAALGHDWVVEARAEVARRPDAIVRHFAAARRRIGRAPLPGAPGWAADEAARAVLLAALPPAELPALLETLYEHGSAEEKHAILRALPLLPLGGEAVPLLRDAVRTNDPRLVTAALGPYARHLDQAAWRQAVLKCVFMGVPLAGIDDLDGRADAELTGMLAGLAEERTAAGRTMPSDAVDLLRRLTRPRDPGAAGPDGNGAVGAAGGPGIVGREA
ncbi:EboA domain-containing protein [Microbispora sp. NPDC049125]|uniref:EboA domain-containing protein n=1 Tax=Microbispora sp. NPDC049125 TaxID=3154929 RepID=UPI003467986E